MSYRVEPTTGGGLPFDATAIPAGTNVLIGGPALTGKRRVAYEILGGAASREGCLVTTKAPAARTRSWFESVVGSLDDWRVQFIDCVSRSTSFDRQPDRPDVTFVSSPGDLTGVGIEMFGTLAGWHEAGTVDPRVCLTSLSTLLMYAELKQVYRFCYVLTGRTRTVGGVGAYTIDTNAGSRQAIDTLKGVFDAFVQVRNEDDRQLRVRGADFGPHTWTSF